MKRIFFLSFLVSFILYIQIVSNASEMILAYDGKAHAYSGATPQIIVAGNPVKTDVPAVIINDKALVPIRSISEGLGADVRWDEGSKTITISSNDAEVELKVNSKKAFVNEKPVVLDTPAKIINDRAMVPIRFVGEALNLSVKWVDGERVIKIDRQERPSEGKIRDIQWNEDTNKVTINISVDNFRDIRTMNLSSPERFVIDISNVNSPEQTQKIPVDNSIIEAIRFGKLNENLNPIKENQSGTRVVIDLSEDAKGSVEKGANGLKVTIYKPQKTEESANKSVKDAVASQGRSRNQLNPLNKVVSYRNLGEEAIFSIKNLVLSKDSTGKGNYSTRVDRSRGKFTVTLRNDIIPLESELIDLKDTLFKTIQIVKGSEYTNIVFESGRNLNYNIQGRKESNSTDIVISGQGMQQDKDMDKERDKEKEKEKEKEKLVVIDPGHGGKEVGAVYESVYETVLEKDLNLDIALRLNKLLKAANIKTVMTREKDVFVGLSERAQIANQLRASLFLSIHNNAYVKNIKGTETLYGNFYDDSGKFGSKDFAGIIQEELIGALGTYDRKLSSRPNVVVLKETKMPAALAEVAFITNEEDRKKLKTEAFRQKAAEALFRAIKNALNKGS